MLPPLNPRLAYIAGRISAGARLIDVGCDHALLAVHYLLKHPTATAIGIDNKEAPLLVARKNRARFGLSERLCLLQCDGIPAGLPEAGDCVVVAGLGGIEIGRILQQAEKLDGAYILSPHSRIDALREAIGKAGLRISNESVVLDGNRAYAVIEAVPGEPDDLSSAETRWLGPVLSQMIEKAYQDPALDLYFRRLETHLANLAKHDENLTIVWQRLKARPRADGEEN